MAIDLQQSILCDLCSNAGRGVKLPGKRICFDCAQSDAELVMPDMAAKLEARLVRDEPLEATIKQAGIK